MWFLEKLKETSLSVLPVMAIVLTINFLFLHLPSGLVSKFCVGGFFLIVGLTFFLIGIDIGLTPVGRSVGSSLIKIKKLPVILMIGFFVGFIMTMAEPDVQVLASQIVEAGIQVPKMFLVVAISLGIGIFVSLGLFRSITGFSLKILFLVFYILIFILAVFAPTAFVPLGFDSGGATTGPMTVPLILAIGIGVTSIMKVSKKSKDGSFGLVGVASIGPVLAVLLLGAILKPTLSTNASEELQEADITLFKYYLSIVPEVIKEVLQSFFPLLLLIVFLQIFLIKLPRFKIRKVFLGLIYMVFGLIIFFTGVKGGFSQTGMEFALALSDIKGGFFLPFVGAIFGLAVVFAEPAVWVLVEQVEDISNGIISKTIMLLFLAFGVGLAVALSIVKIIFGFNIFFLLVPCYALSLLLMIFCPSLWTGIAFDSGGVASGPLSSTFILSFTLGVSSKFSKIGPSEGFGTVAMIAVMPLIVIQLLGVIFKNLEKSKSKNNDYKKSTGGVKK